MRAPFDVAVGTDAAKGVVDVDVFTKLPLAMIHRAMTPSGHMYCFPMDLEEAKTLRDMLNDAIEHVEAGGHGT